jgi:hypothetical protein
VTQSKHQVGPYRALASFLQQKQAFMPSPAMQPHLQGMQQGMQQGMPGPAPGMGMGVDPSMGMGGQPGAPAGPSPERQQIVQQVVQAIQTGQLDLQQVLAGMAQGQIPVSPQILEILGIDPMQAVQAMQNGQLPPDDEFMMEVEALMQQPGMMDSGQPGMMGPGQPGMMEPVAQQQGSEQAPAEPMTVDTFRKVLREVLAEELPKYVQAGGKPKKTTPEDLMVMIKAIADKIGLDLSSVQGQPQGQPQE